MNSSKFILLLFVLTIASCNNNSYSDLQTNTTIPETISFINDVKPIIDNNCIECHKSPPVNFAPMSLLTYNDVKNAVLSPIPSKGLIDRISRTQGSEGMMPSGLTRLPQNKIDIIKKWQAQGFKE